MNIPKLHLQYAYPLDSNRRQLFADRNLGEYPTIEEVIKTADEWKNLWNKLNQDDKVFKLLIETIGVTLPRDLEVYIFGTGLNAMSSPLIMPMIGKSGEKSTNDEFIETIIHEIIHRFVAHPENNENISKYWEQIKEEYKDEASSTQNHILVYAVLEIVLSELYGKERLQDFKKTKNPKHPAYQRAVEIVTEKGAKNLVQQFRDIILE